MISLKKLFLYPFLIYSFLLGTVVANDNWELKKTQIVFRYMFVIHQTLD
jgi:hypothetical protein